MRQGLKPKRGGGRPASQTLTLGRLAWGPSLPLPPALGGDGAHPPGLLYKEGQGEGCGTLWCFP